MHDGLTVVSDIADWRFVGTQVLLDRPHGLSGDPWMGNVCRRHGTRTYTGFRFHPVILAVSARSLDSAVIVARR
jgi:hypothetical protein